MSKRSNALADRIEQGARALEGFANSLTELEWQTRVPKDGRKIGVIVHHVASMYPLEIQVAQTVAAGNPVEGVTWDVVNQINATHAKENDGATKEATLELLRENSAMAAATVRGFTDMELDNATQVSLYANATLTCQFLIEDHALRHSYHHLAHIRSALRKESAALSNS